jgi:hypothetical protein
LGLKPGQCQAGGGLHGAKVYLDSAIICDNFTAPELPSIKSRQRPAGYARILLLRAAEALSSSMALSARRAAEAGN